MITETSEIFDELRLIFQSYDDAKAYVHDEIGKIENFVKQHHVPMEIEPEHEELTTRFEEPILNKSYIGTLFVNNKFWELETPPIASIKVSEYPLMSFKDGRIASDNYEPGRKSYISYTSYADGRSANEH
jgi:hypothetical protein